MVYDNDDESFSSKSRFHFISKALFILVILFGFRIAEALLWTLTFIQYFYSLFTGNKIIYIKEFSVSLGKWNSNAVRFCLGDDIEAPFPFSPWPSKDFDNN